MTRELAYLTRKDAAAAAPSPLEMIDCVKRGYLSRAVGKTKTGMITKNVGYFFSLNTYSEDLCHSLCHNSMGVQIEKTPPSEHHINGLEILSDLETAKSVAVIDSHWMSTWIAAALTGVAAHRLARADSCSIGFIATGAHTRVDLAALLTVLPIERVVAYNRRCAGTEAFAAEVRGQGVELAVTEEPRRTVEGMDVVIRRVPLSGLNKAYIDPAWVRLGVL
jgi:ornithine cyclodeaminase/alanine dehydrogenase-like protein (mu-crystallin family)